LVFTLPWINHLSLRLSGEPTTAVITQAQAPPDTARETGTDAGEILYSYTVGERKIEARENVQNIWRNLIDSGDSARVIVNPDDPTQSTLAINWAPILNPLIPTWIGLCFIFLAVQIAREKGNLVFRRR
jgi:hypothetical protein